MSTPQANLSFQAERDKGQMKNKKISGLISKQNVMSMKFSASVKDSVITSQSLSI